MHSKLSNFFISSLPYLFLILAAFVLYAESFGHQWAMDDHIVLVRNQDIRSWGGFLQDSYPGRPLRELTYLLDYQFFGLEPRGYHIQNILWHGLNASLLVLVVRALGGQNLAAWLAGALFLVHPMNVEVVANISHRKDSLMLFFVQLALLAVMHFYKQPQWKVKSFWGGFGGVLLGVACFAKQSAVGFLPLLLGYELTLTDRRERFFLRYRSLVAFGLAGVLVFAVYWYVWVWQGERFQLNISESMLRMGLYSGWSSELYALMIIKSFSFMFLRLVWPFDLAMEYVYSVPQSWLDPWVVSGLGLLLAACCSMFLLRRFLPLATVGIAWMLAFWLPVSNLLWPLSYFAADRYMYAPCAGFAVLTAAVAIKLLDHRRQILYSFCGLLLLGLVFLTWEQNRVWTDELHLYQQAVKVSPGSTKAVMGLGLAHMNAGQLEKAKNYFEQAAENINDSKALHLLGLVHEKRGNRKEALRYYKKFVQMNEPQYRMDVLSVKRYLKMRYGITP